MHCIGTFRTVFFAVIFCFLAGVIHGHNYLRGPEDEDTPVEIPDIEISRAAYRELGPDARHRYIFSTKENDELFIQITIPCPDGLDTFRPLFLLAIENSESAGNDLIDLRANDVNVKHGYVDFPGKLPEDAAHELESDNLIPLLTLEWDGHQSHFYEHFTGTEYWIRQELTLAAPATGNYSIIVYENTGREGKYILATGKKERFSLAEIVGLPSVRIKVRKFMGKSVAGDYLFWGAILAAVAGGIGYLIYRIIL